VSENRLGERVYRCEILVEVPLGESSFGADVNDSDGRDPPRSEELQAGIDKSLAALVTPVDGADATLWTRHGRDRRARHIRHESSLLTPVRIRYYRQQHLILHRISFKFVGA
jgi:hypothetical protein